MKKIYLLTFALFFIANCFAHTIRGTVYDQKTKEVICFANVYVNGTFTGTTSDASGCFELEVPDQIPVVVSAIGYFSETIDPEHLHKNLTIYLQPKTYAIHDVDVKAKSLKRKRRRYLFLFFEEFIGTSYNSERCEILNEEDITFNYDTDRDTIKAYASKPIIVENQSLGYRVIYYLDRFEFAKKTQTTFFCGNIKFEEDYASDELIGYYYNKKRAWTYYGSRMHFIRSVWGGQCKSQGFSILNPDLDQYTNEDLITIHDDGSKFIHAPTKILIKFGEQKSILNFIEPYVYIEENGFFNRGILWQGEMSIERVADWLPYEYQPK